MLVNLHLVLVKILNPELTYRTIWNIIWDIFYETTYDLVNIIIANVLYLAKHAATEVN